MKKNNMNTNYRRLHEWFFITYDEQSAKHSSKLHSHNTYELFFVTDGACSMLLDDKIINIGKNELVLIKPNYLHKNNGGSRHRRYALHFTDAYLNEYFSEAMAQRLAEFFDNNKLSLSAQAEKIVHELFGRIYNGDEFSPVHLAELIAILSRSDSTTAPHEHTGTTADMILEYINKNYAEICSLDDIAVALCISKPYMCNVFKKETTVTISHYLNSVRINHACELLCSSDKNITETAMLCGYNSPVYFCRIFREIMSMTPNEFRRIYRE